jgi:hypothetical protein
MLEVVVSLSRPKNNLNNIVSHIPIYYKSKTEAKSTVGCFLWIVRRNISITDCCHRINTPIKGVKILYLPIEAVDG